jgi:hypothetical protein
MTESSFASLSPAILARKGGAKPAMRPQTSLPGKINNQTAAEGLEDLGWNDMGSDKAPAAPQRTEASSVVPIKQPAATKADAETAAKTDSKTLSKRAAFTLRLDAERHLRLRLASTVRNCSAQNFVTEALDRMLDSMPEIETLAAQVQRD